MSSGFVTETELEEQRLKRQEEWEKVRKPEEPEEAPEVPYDHRSLFDRLEEQKQKRDLEFEETHKLKNMIRGLDDDEVGFLDLVEQRKLDAELRTNQEEARELREFRDAREKAEEASLVHRLKNEIKTRPTPAAGTTHSSRSSQGRLLAGAVIRKRPAAAADTPAEKKARGSDSPPSTGANLTAPPSDKTDETEDGARKRRASENGVDGAERVQTAGIPTEGVALRCIGILPGLGSYPDSSDSEGSSDTDPEMIATTEQNCFDLVGRKITRQKHASGSAPH